MRRVKPVIAVTLSRPTARNASSIARYRPALERAGAEAIELYPGDPLPERFDGLLLAGGGDIDPSRYGAANEGSLNIDDERDADELELYERALTLNVPVLGICRGLQLINVAHRGSLVQHLDTHGSPHDDLTHQVQHDIRPMSRTRLAESATDEPLTVNSHHHQAVTLATLGAGLTASAVLDDGVVEALEATGERWIVGVQWHPERMHEVSANAPRIFDSFVGEASTAGRS